MRLNNYFVKTELTSKTLVESGGYAIIEQEGRWHFVNYHTSWAYTFNFIMALLVTIFLVNGVVQVVLHQFAGIILLAIAMLCLLGLVFGVRVINKAGKIPLEKLTVTAIVDFEAKNLLNKDGQIISPLSSVQFKRTIQLGSSSYAVSAKWPGGSLILLRGHPFAGGSADFTYVLSKKGLME